MIGDKQAILKDIDRLEIGYQIKLHRGKKENFTPYFHLLTLDSHQHEQLLSIKTHHEQLLLDTPELITFSGIALSKEVLIKKINFVDDNCCFSGRSGLSSPRLGEKFSKIEGSTHSRWKCAVKFNNKKQVFKLVITLDNNEEIVWGKVEVQPIELSKLNLEQIPKIPKNNLFLDKLNQIQSSRQIMQANISKNKNYLFAIGNARSGTTALGKLLNLSPEICLGIERYDQKDNVSAVSFEKDNFFDANSKRYWLRPEIYESLKVKFDTAKYIGDKRPGFIETWKNTFLNLPQAKIIYIFRNIYDVAYSYNIRAGNAAQGLDQQWPTNKVFSEAVKDWNKEIQEIQNLAQFYQVYWIKYEDFFVDPTRMIHLFNYLGVNTEDSNLKLGIERTHNVALSLAKKERILPKYQKEYINAHADFEAYNNLLTLYEREFTANVS